MFRLACPSPVDAESLSVPRTSVSLVASGDPPGEAGGVLKVDKWMFCNVYPSFQGFPFAFRPDPSAVCYIGTQLH